MSKAAITTAIVLGAFFFIGLWFMGNFNSLVTSKAQVDNAWAKVDTQYQRRLDLIGNLVESVKGSQKQEITVFGKIADARTRYGTAVSTGDKAQAANDVETNIALLPRLQEAYPELKSNALMQSLMSDLKDTEGNILGARDTYNNTVTNFNVGIQRFPKNLFASMFGFEKAKLFKSDSGAEKATKVQF